jgi:hypothetical protein
MRTVEISNTQAATKCTGDESCAAMLFALNNPPREGFGLVWQLLVDLKTLAESHAPVYYMRRNRKKGDVVFMVLYCPFCGASLKSVPVDPNARKEAIRQAIELAESQS